jgi:hypothetical protein
MTSRFGAATVVSAMLLARLAAGVASAKLPVYADECPCFWRADGAEWTNRRERVRCAMRALRTAVENGQLTTRDAGRHASTARRSPCGRRAFTLRETCGGPSGRSCPDGDRTRCNIVDPACTGTQLGYCLPPCTAPDGVAPVCGCDGVTYASICRLLDAGVALVHTGDCATGAGAP